MENTILSIFTGIVIAFFSSWITVKLALKKFREEKLWERKFDAYTKIIESLYHVKQQMADEESYLIGEKDPNSIPDDEYKRLLSRYRISREEIAKFKDFGALIISEKAISMLDKYYKDSSEKTDDPYSEIDNAWQAANSCLQGLIPLAKEDLKYT